MTSNEIKGIQLSQVDDNVEVKHWEYYVCLYLKQ